MPNQLLLAASRSPRTRTVVARLGTTRRLVDRFVAGEREHQVVSTADRLIRSGLTVTIDRLGEDTRTIQQARDARDAYVALLASHCRHTCGGPRRIAWSWDTRAAGCDW